MSERKLDSRYEPLAYQLHLYYDERMRVDPKERNTAAFWREIARRAAEFFGEEVPHA